MCRKEKLDGEMRQCPGGLGLIVCQGGQYWEPTQMLPTRVNLVMAPTNIPHCLFYLTLPCLGSIINSLSRVLTWHPSHTS